MNEDGKDGKRKSNNIGKGGDSVSGTGTSGLVVLVVTDVPVSPSSVVTEVCDGFSLGFDGELVEPSPFLSPRRVLTFGQLHRKR